MNSPRHSFEQKKLNVIRTIKPPEEMKKISIILRKILIKIIEKNRNKNMEIIKTMKSDFQQEDFLEGKPKNEMEISGE